MKDFATSALGRTTFVLALLASAISVQAQRGWEAGPWAGVSYYIGDLNTSYDLGLPQLAGGMVARFNFNERLCAKFSGNYGKVKADDARSQNTFERARNLSFESEIIDLSAQFEFNFLPYTHGSDDEFFTPYVFAGLTGFYFNPKAELDGQLYELRDLGTEGQFKGEEYYTISGAFNYGLGIKVDLSYRWSLNFEIGGRSTFTDYLDDVSTVYTNKNALRRARGDAGDIAVRLSDRSLRLPGINEEGQLSLEGRQRGSDSRNDQYFFLGVGALYYFGDIKCPGYGSRRPRR